MLSGSGRISVSSCFFDITKTGRHLWIAVYFRVETETLEIASLAKASASVNEKTKNTFQECETETLEIASLAKASASVNEKTKNTFQECTCELILIP